MTLWTGRNIFELSPKSRTIHFSMGGEISVFRNRTIILNRTKVEIIIFNQLFFFDFFVLYYIWLVEDRQTLTITQICHISIPSP